MCDHTTITNRLDLPYYFMEVHESGDGVLDQLALTESRQCSAGRLN